MKITTQLGPTDQAIACGRRIRSPRNRADAEKRRWKWMVQKAKPYLSKANAYGGSNSNEGGSLPALPVPGSPRPRPSASWAASGQAQGTRRRTCGASAVPRSAGVPLETACLQYFLKVTSNSSATVSDKRRRGITRPLPRIIFLLLSYSSPRPPSLSTSLPRRSSLRAPLYGEGRGWRGCDFPRGPRPGRQGDPGASALLLGKVDPSPGESSRCSGALSFPSSQPWGPWNGIGPK